MNQNLHKFHEIIEYIEQHLLSDINAAALARMANLSVYEFRRVFSFLAGVPIGEYIRKRRLSQAAEELQAEGVSITDAALKYGYHSPSSFTRAFKEFHGFAPENIKRNENNLKMFTRLELSLCMTGGTNLSYRAVHDDEFCVCGVVGESDLSDSECCEHVWNKFYESEHADSILKQSGEKLYAVYQNGKKSVTCHIGARSAIGGQFDFVQIPAGLWLCFDVFGSEDAKINAFYHNILFEFFKSSRYKRDEKVPNLEIFPVNMEEDNFKWEIRIPVKLEDKVKEYEND